MRVVVALTLAALVALIVALLSGSTLAGIAVVMLALAGIVALLRDWRAERLSTPAAAASTVSADEPLSRQTPLSADEFSPDIAGPDQV